MDIVFFRESVERGSVAGKFCKYRDRKRKIKLINAARWIKGTTREAVKYNS